MVNTREAAKVIGCTAPTVRALIRSGKIRARKVKSSNNQFGYEYEIQHKEVRRYCNSWHDPRGRPRINQRIKT